MAATLSGRPAKTEPRYYDSGRCLPAAGNRPWRRVQSARVREPRAAWPREVRSTLARGPQGSLEALRLSPESCGHASPRLKFSPPIGCSVLRRSTTPFNLAKELSHEFLAARSALRL